MSSSRDKNMPLQFQRQIPAFLARMGVRVTDNGRTNAAELQDAATVVRDPQMQDREDDADEAPMVVSLDGEPRVADGAAEAVGDSDGDLVSVRAPRGEEERVLGVALKQRPKAGRRRVAVSTEQEDHERPAAAGSSAAQKPTKKPKPSLLSFGDDE